MLIPPQYLGCLISKLPLGVNLHLTEDQQKELSKDRKYWYWTGRCFQAALSGEKDPFSEGEGLPPRKNQDFIWSRTEMFIGLWKLIESAFEAIKREVRRAGKKFPFESPEILFINVLNEEAIAPIQNSLQPYKEISIPKVRKRIDHCLKGFSGPSVDSKTTPSLEGFQQMRKKYHQHNCFYFDEQTVLNLILKSLERPDCPNRKLIEQSLRQHANTLRSALEDVDVPGLRRRGKWESVFSGSYAWRKGKKLQWSKKGYT